MIYRVAYRKETSKIFVRRSDMTNNECTLNLILYKKNLAQNCADSAIRQRNLGTRFEFLEHKNNVIKEMEIYLLLKCKCDERTKRKFSFLTDFHATFVSSILAPEEIMLT